MIDITLCSSNIFESVRRWKVNKEDLCSDHRRIEFTFGGPRLQEGGGSIGSEERKLAGLPGIYKG